MADKKIERAPVKEYGEHTDSAVKTFAAKNGYDSVTEATRYLAQYALNRLATLDRYAAKKPPKPKKEKKAKAVKAPKAKPKPKKAKAPKAEAKAAEVAA